MSAIAWRRRAALGLALATVGAAAVPSAGLAATQQPLKVGYTVQVKQGALAQGNTVRAKVTVTSPQSNVSDWWSRATITKVVKKGVNNGYQEPYKSQGYTCNPIVRGNTTSFTCRLRGADVPTTIKLRFKAAFAG
jgi:hypothetical protein